MPYSIAARIQFLLIVLTVMQSGLRATPQVQRDGFQVTGLAVNHIEGPVGLDDGPLAFSWKMESDERGFRQTAYRVVVNEKAEAGQNAETIWDSGRVESDQSVSVPYAGKPLVSRGTYSWTVQVWSDRDARNGVMSDAGSFEMALLDEADWSAQWIGAKADGASVEPSPAPLIRKTFKVEKRITSARAYVSGLGYFRMTLNGRPVSDHVLDPVVTRYDKRCKYLVFNIQEHLEPGENVIGMVLGNGWFNQHTRAAWDFDQAPWRANPRMIAQIELLYADGTKATVISDETWRWKKGPIVFDGIRNGIHYDANLEIDGWDSPGFDDSEWNAAARVDAPTDNLSPQLMPPARIIDRLEVTRTNEIDDVFTVYEFPKNTSGRAVVKVSGPPGESITLRYGERVHENGRLDQKEIARFIWTGVPQTDRYTIGESGKGKFEPLFMYHGFQYVEIEKSSPAIQIEAMQANVIHTDLERSGGFECSNPLLNKIYEASINSYLTNYHSYPEDCPHREKIGWTGDAQLVMDFGLFNFDSTRAYLKWLDDMLDEQRPNGQVPGIIPSSGWGYQRGRNSPDPHGYRSAGYGPQWEGVCVSLPWTLYLNTGDIHILQKYYPMMKAYFQFLQDWQEDDILRIGIDDHKWIRIPTEAPIIATAFSYHLGGIMEKAARTLGYESDVNLYQSEQALIKEAFNREFLDEDSGTYDTGSQTSQSLALAFELAPKPLEARVIDKLIESIEIQGGHPVAGVIGVRSLTDVLPRIGRSDLLYAMVDKRKMPSWGWWIEQGATTLWQNWDGSQSRNHIMFGSVNDFFYENLAGIQIDPDQPAYKRFYINPTIIDDLDYAEAWHESPYGEIRSRWERREGSLRFAITVPPNSNATIHLPKGEGNAVFESGRKVEDSKGVEFLGEASGSLVYRLSSGSYTFDLAKDAKKSDHTDGTAHETL